MFGMENLVFMNVSGSSFGTGDEELDLNFGHGARISKFPAMGMLWNFTLHPNPAEALRNGTSDLEFIQIDSKSGDTLDAVQRGQEGIAAISGKAGDEYRIAVVVTEGTWDKVFKGTPDGSQPFDAIESGTPVAVTDAVARIVNSLAGAQQAFLSIQGGTTADSGAAGVVLGDSVDGAIAFWKMFRAATNYQALGFGANELLRATLGVGIGIGNPWTGTPAQALHVKAGNVQIDDFLMLPDSGELTLATGIITPTGSSHRVDTESDAGTDDLVTINGGDEGKLLLITPEHTDRTVVIVSTGNIAPVGDYTMASTASQFLCVYRVALTKWVEISRT